MTRKGKSADPQQLHQNLRSCPRSRISSYILLIFFSESIGSDRLTQYVSSDETATTVPLLLLHLNNKIIHINIKKDGESQ